MGTIRDALDTLAEKVGVAEAAANDMTIADKIDTITAAVSSPSNSKDIAEAVEKFGEVAPEYTDGYTLLSEEPADWEDNYGNYYKLNSNDEYVPVTKVEEDEYTLTTEEPADWEDNYTDYYTESGGVYTPVPRDDVPPTWEASTYYSKSTVMVVPTFAANTYYSKNVW